MSDGLSEYREAEWQEYETKHGEVNAKCKSLWSKLMSEPSGIFSAQDIQFLLSPHWSQDKIQRLKKRNSRLQNDQDLQ